MGADFLVPKSGQLREKQPVLGPGVCVTFSLFFKIWLTESILIFRETCFLLTSNTLRHKFFSDEAAFTEMVPHRLVRTNYSGKLPVSIKYQNLHSFKEGMIHLCESILETRWISHLHGSAPFTIPLKSSLWDHFRLI